MIELLGVLVNNRTPGSSGLDMDANNCYNTGFYYIRTSGNKNLMVRHYADSVWSDWVHIYDESILTNPTLLSPLASALGGVKSGVMLSADTDLNDIKDYGFYMLEYINQMDNTPSTDDSVQHGYMIIDGWGDARAIQTIFVGHKEQRIFQRSYTGSIWTQWVLLSQHSYMQPYTDLSSLASALGVIQSLEDATTGSPDSQTTNSVRNYKGANVSGLPEAASSESQFCVICLGVLPFLIQFCYKYRQDNHIWVRISWGTWDSGLSAWKKITLE